MILQKRLAFENGIVERFVCEDGEYFIRLKLWCEQALELVTVDFRKGKQEELSETYYQYQVQAQ